MVRQLRQGIVPIMIPLLLVSGCATTRYHEQALATVSEADRAECEEFARIEIEAQERKSVGAALVEPFTTAFESPRPGESHFYRGQRDLFLLLFSPILGPINAIMVAQGNEAAHEDVLNACLEPRILERTLGPEHPDLATSLDSLAERHERLARHAEAEALRARALLIREKVFGAESPEVAGSLHILALRLWVQGRYTEAEALYKRILAVGEKAWGPDNHELASTLAEYGGLLRDLDRQAEADEMEGRADAIRAKLYPK